MARREVPSCKGVACTGDVHYRDAMGVGCHEIAAVEQEGPTRSILEDELLFGGDADGLCERAWACRTSQNLRFIGSDEDHIGLSAEAL